MIDANTLVPDGVQVVLVLLLLQTSTASVHELLQPRELAELHSKDVQDCGRPFQEGVGRER